MRALSNSDSAWLTTGSNATRVGIRLVLAILFATCWPHFAAAAATGPISISRGLPFAVADFDGDHQPDLASVQAGANGASSSNYVVRFRLSNLGRRYVRVTAPEGGLLIEARDVNGDNTIDLVVASAWLDKPVAILLNDGNGNFSQVDPANYPEALRSSGPRWNSSRNQDSSVFGLPQGPSGSDASLADSGEAHDTNREAVKARATRLASNRAVTFRTPRAPPLTILL
ncbi:MAG TPA: VCBS repeat-containing protein [Candidatus Acidoferrales bacterium]